MDALFGGMPDAARFLVAFVVVLGLIGAGAYLWRRYGVGPLALSGPRGRQPRLAVIDAATVDGRRRLVLVRRDNTEHLLMIGGPTDIVIEPNIARAGSGNTAREPRGIPDLPLRPPPDAANWPQAFEPPPRVLRPLEPAEMPLPEPALRPPPLFPERLERATPSPAEVVAPSLAAVPPEPAEPVKLPDLPPPATSSVPVEPPPATVYEPVFQTAPEPPPAHEPVFQSLTSLETRRTPPRPSQNDENNLVEMAQRLEAALRRPTRPVEAVAPPAPPPPSSPQPAEPVVPILSTRPTGRVESAVASRVASYFSPPGTPGSAPAIRPVTREEPEDNSEAQQTPALVPAPPAPAPKPAPTYASLEEEMASLLGRGPGKT